MAKKWYPELFEPIDGGSELSQEEYYGPAIERQFYNEEDPDKGYEVRGLKPIYRVIENPERDSY